nr:hypothetical protein [Gemmatimonadaceae bacterium]
TITRIAYGRLALGDGSHDGATSVDSIWRALASVALLNERDETTDGARLLDLDAENGHRGGPGSGAGPGRSDGGDAHDGATAPGPRVTTAAGASSDRVTGLSRRSGAGSGVGGTSGGIGTGRGGGGGGADGSGHGDGEREIAVVGDDGDRLGEQGAHGGGGGGEGGGGGIAIEGADAELSLAATEPSEVAQAIERRIASDGYAKRVAYVLLRVAGQVAQAPPEQRASLGERLRAVLSSLKSSSLGAIIKSVGVGSEQRRFIAEMIDALPVAAIVEWLETAANASGQELSHHLLRIIGKLSSRAYAGGAAVRPGADSAFRGAAQELVRNWSLEDPNPVEHVALLDHISVFERPAAQQVLEDTGASRLVQLALEIDACGEDTMAAVEELIRTGRVAELFAWMTDAPGTAAAEAIQAHLVSPSAVRAVLMRDPVDQGAARALLASLDIAATEVLLDVLRDASGRTTRRIVYDRLREFGPSITPQLTRRLDSEAWYFVRNLLALLRDIGSAEGGQADATILFPYLDHSHEQVRLEALRLLVAEPLTRDAAVRRVLDDGSDRVVRVALESLANVEGATRRALSPELVQRLLRFVEAAVHADDLIARAVRALGDAAPSLAIRDLLLGLTTKRTLVLRRLALLEPRPAMLAALEVLALRYRRDVRGASVLALAERAADGRIREAVQGLPVRTLAAAS